MSTTPLHNALTKLGLARGDAKEVADGLASAEDVVTKAELAEVKSYVKKHTDNVATKMDIAEVKTQIAKVETQIAELKVTLLIALAVYTGVGVGVVTFLIKI